MTDDNVTALRPGVIRVVCPACRITAGGIGAVLLECVACGGAGVIGLTEGPDGGLDPDELERTVGRLRAYALVMRLDGLTEDDIADATNLPDELISTAVELGAGAHVEPVQPVGYLPVDEAHPSPVYDPAVAGAPADNKPQLYVAGEKGIIRT